MFFVSLTGCHADSHKDLQLVSSTLHLQVPPRPPRVYAGALGVAVTRVRAVDDHHNNDQQTVRYSLYESPVTDYKYFTIDEYGGNITTARYLERLVGEQYRVIVVAMMSGNANNTELTIFVTHYNQYDPRLSLQHY
ncbi:uncharacterized protein LOC121875895, partial [Homarus americanus]|uniref:uncharacterized protein LOC121875895 n=1 Tax=Homarus americanus TaxID=6706 RepID=UPI001C4932F4